MRYCPNCGSPIPDDARFCGRCGSDLQPLQGDRRTQRSNNNGNHAQGRGQSAASSFVDHLNEYVGNDRPADLNWRMLFTDVFKSHTVEEAEDIFICGTHATTPSPQLVSKEWPRPWLYSRVFLMFTAAFALLWLCCNLFGNPNALPGMIVVGSFTVPLSTMIMFMEVNAWRNISLYKVIQTFLVGGCASLVATLMLFSIVGSHELNLIGAIVTGIVEEAGKAVIVFWFLSKMKRLSILRRFRVGRLCLATCARLFPKLGLLCRLWQTARCLNDDGCDKPKHHHSRFPRARRTCPPRWRLVRQGLCLQRKHWLY